MTVSVRLQARQTQNLTMTPQLAQSIKLLQMGQAELLRHIEEALEKNPLLETGETEIGAADEAPGDDLEKAADRESGGGEDAFGVSDTLDTSISALEDKLGTSLENSFEADLPSASLSGREPGIAPVGSERHGGNAAGGDAGDGIANLEEYVAGQTSLRDHLASQLALSRAEAPVLLLASVIIDCLETDGYLRRPIDEVAEEAGATAEQVQAALQLVQSFEPRGVGARDLAECLALQLRERNRFDPAMAALLANLELLARRDYGALERVCGVDLADILEMAAEIRSLDPRPGSAFDQAPSQVIVPDACVRERPDGSFLVELLDDALPRLLVNRSYQAIVSSSGASREDKAFVSECLQEANWLIRSLEQRAQTILKTVREIVRQQDGFFAHGISHLRPMSLKQVADAIGMHESTISRVTSNKYVETTRGIYELKFFFTSAISGTSDSESHSSEAVRLLIRNMIESEEAEAVLSDDAIVDALRKRGVDIARRTVAKYREGMQIPSSVQRRREKRAMRALSKTAG